MISATTLFDQGYWDSVKIKEVQFVTFVGFRKVFGLGVERFKWGICMWVDEHEWYKELTTKAAVDFIAERQNMHLSCSYL